MEIIFYGNNFLLKKTRRKCELSMQDVTVVDNQDILLVNAPSNVRAAVVSDVVLVADKVNVISAVVGFLNLFLIFSELLILLV